MNALKIGDVIKVSGVTIIPVEKMYIYSDCASSPSWWYGGKEIYALVVSSSLGLQAFDCDAQELSVNDLINYVPELDEVLQPFYI